MTSSGDTEFVIVRHGQTDANRAHILQGQLDSSLDELGRRQARALAERLRKEPFDRIFSSCLSRAVDTAEAIRAFHPGLPFEVLPDLMEWHLGDLEGKPMPELEKEYPDIMAAFRRESEEIAIPGGESKMEFQRRISGCLDFLADRHPGERILLVSHGGVLRAAFRKAVGKTAPENLLSLSGNASLNVFRRCRAGWQMVVWNDSSHLNGVGQNDLFQY